MQRLSIILPAKNEAEGLQRTLPALRQAWPRAEIIVVDDGSSDATAALCAGHGVV
ncbi:MAG: glycosyltransferase, partial [Stenotrophomonas nitritireducens]|nr:glycosyltransferase [Stenotrophomonas nitritireducens]